MKVQYSALALRGKPNLFYYTITMSP